jgi:lipoprotein-anchoring transpeptidase ErfK/SrfK
MGSARQNGKVWLKVQLSKRPNGATAWVPADQVLVRRNTYRVVVDISSRTVTAFKGARKAFSSKAVVGSSATPTPTGTFAVLESVPQPRGSKLGSTVIALTAHSNVHKTFDGGDGRVGIHGYERLGNRLGSAASNGCIRIPASTLKKLAQATPGTPVIVQQ